LLFNGMRQSGGGGGAGVARWRGKRRGGWRGMLKKHNEKNTFRVRLCS
jgi:hypothetical protein